MVQACQAAALGADGVDGLLVVGLNSSQQLLKDALTCGVSVPGVVNGLGDGLGDRACFCTRSPLVSSGSRLQGRGGSNRLFKELSRPKTDTLDVAHVRGCGLWKGGGDRDGNRGTDNSRSAIVWGINSPISTVQSQHCLVDMLGTWCSLLNVRHNCQMQCQHAIGVPLECRCCQP